MYLKKMLLPISVIGLLSFTGLIYATQKATTEKSLSTKANPEMQKVLDALASLKGKLIPQLTPDEARLQPTPTDAVMKVLKDEGKSTVPEQVASIKDISIPGPYGEILAHVYNPNGSGPFQ